MFVLSSSNIHKHFNIDGLPGFLKGNLQVTPDEHAAWLQEMKAFYVEQFQPMMVGLADAPGSVKPPSLWETALKK